MPQTDPWSWVIDPPIQVGSKKRFLIVGRPMSEVPFGQRCSSLADLHSIALVPMGQSNQYLVDAELEKATQRTGVPRLIQSDQAGDLTKGIELFRERHEDTLAVGDIAHYAANVPENRWERDPRWKELLKKLGETNRQIRQTADASLVSPTLRNEARFMNVGPLRRFVCRVLASSKKEDPNARAKQTYGWLLNYEEDLAGWREQYDMVHARNWRRSGGPKASDRGRR